MADPADVLSVCPGNVWGYAQNRPTLIASDLARFGVPRSVTYAILMARGVFKWLSVRRDLIKLKDNWRGESCRLQAAIASALARGDRSTAERLRARLTAYDECRFAVRALCHSDRWRAPDFDGPAWEWLRSRGDFKPVGRWVDVVRQSRHARVGSDVAPDRSTL